MILSSASTIINGVDAPSANIPTYVVFAYYALLVCLSP